MLQSTTNVKEKTLAEFPSMGSDDPPPPLCNETEDDIDWWYLKEGLINAN